MGIMGVPKAVYKAQQAKKRMAKIEGAGKDESVIVVLNGLNDVKEVEFDMEELREVFENKLSDDDIEKVAKKLSKQVKKAFESAKKQVERELISSTNMDDLKGLLGG